MFSTASRGIDVSMPLPLGVSADTGRPLDALERESLSSLSSKREQQAESEKKARIRDENEALAYAVISDAGDPNDLSGVGWGVIFSAEADPAVAQALAPLIEHRRNEAGGLLRVFDGAEGYQRGDTATSWLERKGIGFGPVNPLRGVPFYLLVVGSPEDIPFEFQYELDIYWGVGRLSFESGEDYGRYAASVIAYETAPSPPHSRQIVMFAPEHDFDRATQMFVRQVATPLGDVNALYGPLGAKQKFMLQKFIGSSAKKDKLADVLTGNIPNGPPAVLFTGSHGMCFRADDGRQSDSQGALICSDWEGYGRITEDSWFSASDIPEDARVNGLIHFFFACYGAGYPKVDNFDRLSSAPKTVALKPSISRFPQRMLTRADGGALACVGHIDRAWAYSFINSRGQSQPDSFRDVIARVCYGDRIGQATDTFNVRWTALSSELLERLCDRDRGIAISDTEIATRWVSRDDARNYVVLGDPAVRLRVNDLPILPAS
jgi:hypothetical protein